MKKKQLGCEGKRVDSEGLVPARDLSAAKGIRGFLEGRDIELGLLVLPGQLSRLVDNCNNSRTCLGCFCRVQNTYRWNFHLGRLHLRCRCGGSSSNSLLDLGLLGLD